LLTTLAAAEAAFDAYTTLGLPAPMPDHGLGGTDGYDLYLVPGAMAAESVPDPALAFGATDRTSAFGVLPPPEPRPSCSYATAVARLIADAMLQGIDAGANRGTLEMQSSYLATLASPCLAAELDAVQWTQRFPEWPLGARRQRLLSGALLFPWYLDANYGVAEPGSIMTALFCLGAQQSPASSTVFFADKPNVLEVLRHAAARQGTTLDDMLLDFGIARAFLGSRSDGVHLPETEPYGDFARPRFEWAVPYASLPRRLAPLRPIYPTGATYLWVDLAGAPAGSQLLLQADWEPALVFRWAAVKVDAKGQEAGRVVPPGIYGNNSLQFTVADLDGLAGIVVVGTNIGSDDRSHPYDPNDPAVPAEYTVMLYNPATL